jgi:hypothetical protein
MVGEGGWLRGCIGPEVMFPISCTFLSSSWVKVCLGFLPLISAFLTMVFRLDGSLVVTSGGIVADWGHVMKLLTIPYGEPGMCHYLCLNTTSFRGQVRPSHKCEGTTTKRSDQQWDHVRRGGNIFRVCEAHAYAIRTTPTSNEGIRKPVDSDATLYHGSPTAPP